MGDPEVLYGRLATGDAGRIAEVADSVDTAVSTLDLGADALDRALSVEGWVGAAASGYRGRVVDTSPPESSASWPPLSRATSAPCSSHSPR